MKKKKRRRLRSFMAAALCFSLIFTQTAPTAYAAKPEAGQQQTLCEHHPAHDEACGYTEGSEGTPCTHEHTEDCYTLVTECVHEHTEDCYPAEIVSDNAATPSEPNEAEPTECTHECSGESGCITKKLDCQHEHDSECGYTPAIEGTPCKFVCEICNSQNQPQSDPKECICTDSCTEDNINEECPVCGEDFTDCEGVLLATSPDALAVTPEQVQEMIDDLPTAEELQAMSAEEQQEVYTKLQAAYDAYEALTDEQKEQITGVEIFDSLFDVFDELTALAADDIGFTIEGSGESYTYEDGVLTVQDNADLTISTSEQTSHRVVVANGATATITLDGVNIVTTDTNIPIDVPANSTLLLKLNDNTENIITAAGVRIGPASPGIHVPKDATLIIQGEGGITVNGGTSISGFAGAGIGGKVVMEQTGYCPGEPCGTVIILSTGTIEISGGQNVDTSSSGKDIGGGRGSLDGDDGQGIRPVSGQANTYEVWGELTLPEGVTIPEGAILTGDGSFAEGSKIEQSAPASAPTASKITDTSVTLNAVTGGIGKAQYACVENRDGNVSPEENDWQNSPTFDNRIESSVYTLYTRYDGNNFYKPSPASDGLTVVTAPPPSAVTINYDAETISFIDKVEVSPNQNFSTLFQTNESILAYLGLDVYVRAKVEDGTGAPIRGVTTVSLLPRPNYADGITAVNASAAGVNDGKITGVSANMEYKKVDAASWTDCTGNTIEKLAPGTYEVRTKATENSFASLSKKVTIGVGNIITITLPTFDPVRTGYTQPDPKPIEICNSSDEAATIESVSCTGVVFKIQVEPTPDLLKIPAHGKNTYYALRPEPGMVAGEYTSPITVTCRDTHNNTHTVSATAHFTVLPEPTSEDDHGDGGDDNDDDRDDNDATVTKRPDADKPNIPTTVQTEKIEADGKGNVTITKPVVTAAIEAAEANAKKNNNMKNGIAVDVPVEISKDLSGVQITLKADALDKLTASNVKRFTIDTDSMTDFGFTLDTLGELNRQTSGDIVLKGKKTAVSSAEAKAAIENRPVYDISLWEAKNGRETQITNLNGRTISIAIPYIPVKGEQPGNLYAVYVDDAGKVEWITKSSYDADRKAVIFEMMPTGIYGVGYDAKVPAFPDIENHWAKDNILFAASRGLLNGTSENTFSPDTGMTRGMFVTALGRLAGINPDSCKTGKFTDVKADAYYAPYVNWAAQTGIVSGTAETAFAPDNSINREQMAVILKNYAAKQGYTIPKTLEAVTFADNAGISSWAREAVKSMQQAGILAGKTNNQFAPKGTATRAEAATVLRRFVEIIIDPQTANGWGQNDSGEWSYYKNGEPVKGWLSDGQKWYWLDKAAGKMFANGWKQIDSKWYYFYADGSMAVNTTIDGKTVGADGARTN